MTLKSNNLVEAPLQPYLVLIRSYSPGTFELGVEPTGGTSLDADIQSITTTSDATPGTLNFTINDEETTFGGGTLTLPSMGDEIMAKAVSVGSNPSGGWNDNDMDVLFKGFVVNISHQLDDNGSVYSIECSDMKARLTDETINKVYNEKYDNHLKPNFAADGTFLLDESLWTVKQIIKDIMETAEDQIFTFHSSLTPLTYWGWNSAYFDFSQVPDLEDYVPEMLNFENMTVLECIYRTISSAGTYRMVYNPRTDKLVFTKVSVAAYEAGNERPLFFATASNSQPNKDYVHDNVTSSSGNDYGKVNVIKDNTVRQISEIASVYRMYGGEIEWYTGHYRISKNQFTADYSPNATATYYMKNYNWDGYQYVFASDSIILPSGHTSGDYVLVGAPLYPAWNPSTGYEPYEITLEGVNLLNSTQKDEAGTIDNTTYAGDQEYLGVTVNDALFPKSAQVNSKISSKNYNQRTGMVYEAWYPWRGECLYCDGTGAVEDTSLWEGHEEEWFGDSRDEGGYSRSKPNMETFDYQFIVSNGELKPQRHPVPWLNTCPACRGTGREPRFRIRNILGSVLDLPPSEVKVEEALADPSGYARVKTWNEFVGDNTYQYGPKVQLETSVADRQYPAVKFGDGETIPHPLANVYCKTYLPGATAEDRRIIKKAADRKIRALYKTQVSMQPDGVTIDNETGNVILQARHGIVCNKAMYMISKISKGRASYTKKYQDKNDVTVYSDTAIDRDRNSFWRPARAWITCYFRRPKFFDDVPVEAAEYNQADRHGQNPVTIISPSGVNPEEIYYKVRMSIKNDRPVYEVYKQSPGETEFDARVRPIVKSDTVEEFRWQICPDDIFNLPVPEKSDYSYGAVEGLLDDYVNRKYYFPYGAIHVIENLKYNEREALAWAQHHDILRTMTFPKRIEWTQRDDRYKLIEYAIKELEKANDISISGNVVVRGENYDLSTGLGYVEYDDGTRAVVVKMTHDFSGGAYITTMELSTEEFRLGERTEEEKDSANLMRRRVSKRVFSNSGIGTPKISNVETRSEGTEFDEGFGIDSIFGGFSMSNKS